MILIQNSAYLDFLSTLAIEGAHPGGIKLTKELFKKEDINSTSQVLDVGCGTGQTAAYLAYKYEANVTGIDINPTMVARAKRRMEKNSLPVEIIQGSVEKIPLPDNHFDFIISESVLSFVDKPNISSSPTCFFKLKHFKRRNIMLKYLKKYPFINSYLLSIKKH